MMCNGILSFLCIFFIFSSSFSTYAVTKYVPKDRRVQNAHGKLDSGRRFTVYFERRRTRRLLAMIEGPHKQRCLSWRTQNDVKTSARRSACTCSGTLKFRGVPSPTASAYLTYLMPRTQYHTACVLSNPFCGATLCIAQLMPSCGVFPSVCPSCK